MGKSNDRNVTAEQEFASLEKVLNQSADDAARCLKLLKKNLSEYDSRHGNHFINTASSYMRSDMRTAKDTASDLKQVAHDIHKCAQPSESEIVSARNMMGATDKAMEILRTTARNYDQKNGRSKGVKGAIDNVVGNNDREKDEKHTGLLGKNKDEKHIGLFGKTDKGVHEKHTGLLGKDKDEKHTRLLGGKTDNKDKDGGQLGGKTDHHHGGVGLGSDTVEELTKTTLRDNFNLSALSHQITIADKALSSPPTKDSPSSPTFVDRAKEAVTEMFSSDKTSPTHDGHHAGKHAVTP